MLSNIKTVDQYLTHRFGETDNDTFGNLLIKRAVSSLQPLHVPGRDATPDYSYLPEHRRPYPAQANVTEAVIKLIDDRKNGFIIGEMGTGKSLMACLCIHEHAKRKQCTDNPCYRAIVLCPDHLIDKWRLKEIMPTIPNPKVYTFKSWTDFLGLANSMRRTSHGKPSRWPKPEGPEWYIVGRNQIKWEPEWRGLGEPARMFNGKVRSELPSRPFVVDRKPETTESGEIKRDGNGNVIEKNIIERYMVCPKCGMYQPDNKGVPISAKSMAKKQMTCGTLYLEALTSSEREAGKDKIILGAHQPYAGRRRERNKWAVSNPREGMEINIGGKKYIVRRCGEPLWQWTSKPKRWPPSKIIHSKLKGFFKYLICDEAHEQKSDESAQSMAMGKVLASTDYAIALTGTFIGGYANHLFPLLMRMFSGDMRSRGFKWGRDMDFSVQYGVIERVVTTLVPADDTFNRMKGTRSMRRSASRAASKTEHKVRPGIMPTLFGHIVHPIAVFIGLEEMVDELPYLDECLHGVHLPPYVHAEYLRVERELANALVGLGPKMMKLMGRMLHTLLAYPDWCWEWAPLWEGEHSVGWWDLPKVMTKENWHGVVSPMNFDTSIIMPKERDLIDYCKEKIGKKEQVWVYCQMTDKKNVMPRLASLLKKDGLRACVMRSGDQKPTERYQWLIENGSKYDVMLSHPKLVSTGLDLFDNGMGDFNFNNINFYQTGYNLFDLEQASRRSWRISQERDCEVRYQYYRGTMQERAMLLMSRKSAARRQLQGDTKFSENSLAALSGDTSAQMALVKSLSEHIGDDDIQRNWGKVRSGGGRHRKNQETVFRDELEYKKAFADSGIPEPGTPSPLDDLPIAQQAVAETIVKVFNPEDSPSRKFSREELADLFRRINSGQGIAQDDEDWDW